MFGHRQNDRTRPSPPLVPLFAANVLCRADVSGRAARAWLGVQVKWIRDRHEALENLATPPGVGELSAPWPLRLFGENGVPSMVVTSDQARDAHQKLFPESLVFQVRALEDDDERLAR